jgi:succinyl-CoA synthetase alpha subunit
MSILLNEETRVCVQGITGREGAARTRLMAAYGTQVVAGVTPGKGGSRVEGVPVFDTMADAWKTEGPFDVSVLFVPAPIAKDAALEAIAAGVPLVVLVPDRVPLYDVLELDYYARTRGARFLGPNTIGMASPGRATVGMLGGRAENARRWFRQGKVGVISRSGGMTASIAYHLTKAGLGQSTIVHVGGDPIVGMPMDEVLRLFAEDEETDMVVAFGEIGTAQEERCARLLADGVFPKPLVAFISGAAAREGARFSHAGAIVEGGRGTYQGKVATLRDAGAHVVESFGDIFPLAAKLMDKGGRL